MITCYVIIESFGRSYRTVDFESVFERYGTSGSGCLRLLKTATRTNLSIECIIPKVVLVLLETEIVACELHGVVPWIPVTNAL